MNEKSKNISSFVKSFQGNSSHVIQPTSELMAMHVDETFRPNIRTKLENQVEFLVQSNISVYYVSGKGRQLFQVIRWSRTRKMLC